MPIYTRWLTASVLFNLKLMLQALANQVCEKVESKVRTTYNEVADELVSEFGNVEGTGTKFSSFLALCGVHKY